jgi:hypothetical protein
MKKYIIVIFIAVVASSCDYMDIIPDDVPTIETVFNNREQAEKFLFTCYSFLPPFGTDGEPGMVCGDHSWYHVDINGRTQTGWDLMRMGNNVSSPRFNFWGGRYAGIRYCNVFLENINNVPDMNNIEKTRWAAEVKFIKAFHHFWLLQMYGPIPIVRENLPIDATPEEAAVFRDPVDEVVDYIVQLINEAVPDLPLKVENEVSELGRITQAIALAVKAKVLVTAASPLFNGNTLYAQLKDKRERVLFNQDTSEETKRRKWQRAAVACKNAIDTCHLAGHVLYEFTTATAISEDTRKVVQVQQIIADRWNKEHIWGRSLGAWLGGYSIQISTMPRLHSDHMMSVYQQLVATMKMAELFYSKNGVPIDVDKEFDYEGRYSMEGLTSDDTYHRYFLQPFRTTAKLHQNREHRFYGALGVDGGWWYGIGRNDDRAQWSLNFKLGATEGGRIGTERYSVTGFYVKKLSNYLNSYSGQTLTQRTFNWPVFRLADLYLLYAEALNESLDAPNGDVYYWIDEVRNRAGLKGLVASWEEFSRDEYLDRYKTKDGMRSIIQQERNIELSFEGHRFWDMRRWGLVVEYFRQPIQGWNIEGDSEGDFYNVVTLARINYALRDVLWPIQESEIQRNPNLVQNPGW